jgi:hypothetical protein
MSTEPMDVEVMESPPPRRRGRRVVLFAAVTALALGAGGVAFAATGSSPSTGSSAGAGGVLAADSAESPPTPGPGEPPRPGGGQRGMGHFGPRGFGGGIGGFALHGEYVTQKSGGGYQTVDIQSGTVSDVSSSSITVKSADGFSKSYKVTSDTLVGAKRDGIGTVKKGDTVHVTATVSGGTATAVQVADISQWQSMSKDFGPGPRPRDGTDGNGGTSSSSSTATTT